MIVVKNSVQIQLFFCPNPSFRRGRLVERRTLDQGTLFKWGHGEKFFSLFFAFLARENDSRPLVLYTQPVSNTFPCLVFEKY